MENSFKNTSYYMSYKKYNGIYKKIKSSRTFKNKIIRPHYFYKRDTREKQTYNKYSDYYLSVGRLTKQKNFIFYASLLKK